MNKARSLFDKHLGEEHRERLESDENLRLATYKVLDDIVVDWMLDWNRKIVPDEIVAKFDLDEPEIELIKDMLMDVSKNKLAEILDM